MSGAPTVNTSTEAKQWNTGKQVSPSLKFKRLHFELAKQQPEENPWRYENRLLLYYRAVQINDEGWFVEINKKGTTHP